MLLLKAIKTSDLGREGRGKRGTTKTKNKRLLLNERGCC